MSEFDNEGWNNWWHANFRSVTDDEITEAVGYALHMTRKELSDEIATLRAQVAELRGELERARADNIIALPRSAWKHDAAA
jgi:hypothetical protein